MERYVVGTGADGADMRIRVRYCREGGYLQSSARKSTTPQIELVQAVVMLLVHTVAGVQTSAVERMRKLWHLPLNMQEPEWFGGERPSTAARDALAGLNAGLALAAMIEAEVSPVLRDGKILTPGFPSEFPTISISHKADWIKLWGNSQNNVADVWFCAPEARASVPFGDGHIAPFISSTTIMGVVLSQLANLVRDSRREAFVQDIAIPIEDVCKALGTEAPNKNYWRDRLLQPNMLPSDAATDMDSFQNENAGAVGAAPASTRGRPDTTSELANTDSHQGPLHTPEGKPSLQSSASFSTEKSSSSFANQGGFDAYYSSRSSSRRIA